MDENYFRKVHLWTLVNVMNNIMAEKTCIFKIKIAFRFETPNIHVLS